MRRVARAEQLLGVRIAAFADKRVRRRRWRWPQTNGDRSVEITTAGGRRIYATAAL